MAAVLREIVIDCHDPRALAAWWREVLGWVLVEEDPEYCWLSSDGTRDAPCPVLTFLTVPEPKSVKNRLHLDLCRSGTDHATELARLLALGARHVDVGQGAAVDEDVTWVVLADPEGNEFCLLDREV